MAATGATTATVPPLDAWLPDPQIRTHHRRATDIDADTLWAAASALRLSDTRALGRLVRWRIPGTAPGLTFQGLLAQYPFAVLEEGERYALSGLCGRIWTLRRDYARLRDAEEFRAWSEAGTVRVLMANWVQPASDGRTELCSEARVAPVDRGASIRLRALWAGIGRFEPLIGSEAVTQAVSRAGRGAS